MSKIMIDRRVMFGYFVIISEDTSGAQSAV